MTKVKFKPEVLRQFRANLAAKQLVELPPEESARILQDLHVIAATAGVELDDEAQHEVIMGMVASGELSRTNLIASFRDWSGNTGADEGGDMSPEEALEHLRSLPEDEAEEFVSGLTAEEFAWIQEAERAQENIAPDPLVEEVEEILNQERVLQTADRDVDDQIRGFAAQLGRPLLQREIAGIGERAELQVGLGQRVDVDAAFKRYYLDKGEEPPNLEKRDVAARFFAERAKDIEMKAAEEPVENQQTEEGNLARMPGERPDYASMVGDKEGPISLGRSAREINLAMEARMHELAKASEPAEEPAEAQFEEAA